MSLAPYRTGSSMWQRSQWVRWEEPDVCIVKLGGTVGGIKSAPFVEVWASSSSASAMPTLHSFTSRLCGIKSFWASVRPHKSMAASASARLPGVIGSTKLNDEATNRESSYGIKGSHIQVDTMTRCVGQECGFDVCLGLSCLSCCQRRGW